MHDKNTFAEKNMIKWSVVIHQLQQMCSGLSKDRLAADYIIHMPSDVILLSTLIQSQNFC